MGSGACWTPLARALEGDFDVVMPDARGLAQLDQVVWDLFATKEAKDAVRKKVAALFPPHEIETLTELFSSRIEDWRKAEKP